MAARERGYGQRGNAVIMGLVAATVAIMAASASYSRFGYTKQSFRIARVKSIMGAVAAQVRTRALQPEAYFGCSSGSAGGCQVNAPFFEDLRHQPVPGAVCPASVPQCGILLDLRSFDTAAGSFRAELRYEGAEVNPKPLEISVEVPHEVLQSDFFHCGMIDPNLPIFVGFDSASGRPICRGFNSCGPGQYVASVDVTRRTVGCRPLPAAVGCPDQKMITAFSWNGGSANVVCSELPPPVLGEAPVTVAGGCSGTDLAAAKASMIDTREISVEEVASACIDAVNPSLADNVPNSEPKLIRFMNTCGNRWCQAKGFYAGRGVENNGPVVRVECRRAAPAADTPQPCKTKIADVPPMKALPATINAVAEACRDAANPGLDENLPTSESATARFVVTCGNRYCVARGYGSGSVVEHYGGGATVLCYDPRVEPGDDGASDVRVIAARKNDVRDNCIDDANPTSAMNEPGVNLFRFTNTCGNRYCIKLGHVSGKVTEIPPGDDVFLTCH